MWSCKLLEGAKSSYNYGAEKETEKHNALFLEQLLHTSLIDSELEEAKAEISSKFAFEQALCKRTTFCTASMWEQYKALDAVTFFFKSITA